MDLIRDQFVSGKTINDIRAIEDLRLACKDNNNREVPIPDLILDESSMHIHDLPPHPETIGQTSRYTTFYPNKVNPTADTSRNTAGMSWSYANNNSNRNSFDSEEYTLKAARNKG